MREEAALREGRLRKLPGGHPGWRGEEQCEQSLAFIHTGNALRDAGTQRSVHCRNQRCSITAEEQKGKKEKKTSTEQKKNEKIKEPPPVAEAMEEIY